MTVSKKSLKEKVDDLFAASFNTYETEDVPTIDDSRLTHGATGLEGEFAFLYADIRGSSDFSTTHRRQTIAKIYKAFHYCMVEVIKDKGGYVRSFDGDRVMGVFGGSRKVNNAVEAAMLMIGCKKDVLAPKIKARYKNETFDIGIGIATGKTLAIKAGQGYDVNNRDLVWIGDPPNLGAKLSDEAKHPHNIFICETTYGRLLSENRWHTDENGNDVDMWKSHYFSFSNNYIWVYKSSWYRHLSD